MFTLVNENTKAQIELKDKEVLECLGITKKHLKMMKKGSLSLLFIPVSNTMISPKGATKITLVREKDKKHKKKMKGTCIMRMGGVGDLIMLSSSLTAYKKKYPELMPLTVATIPNHMPYIKSIPTVDRVIELNDLARYKFDKEIDLVFHVEPPELGNHCKGTWLDYTLKDRSDVFDELLGVYPAEKNFHVSTTQAKMCKMARRLTDTLDKSGDPIVAINASMVSAARSIIPKYIKPLSDYLIDKGNFRVILMGQYQPWNKQYLDIKENGRLVNIINQTDFFDLVAAISLADIVVTPDTGTLHIAGALKKRTVALFGNINPRTRISYYPTVRALYNNGANSCVPCWDLHPCMNGRPESGTKCMKAFTPKIIAEEVIQEGKLI